MRFENLAVSGLSQWFDCCIPLSQVFLDSELWILDSDFCILTSAYLSTNQ